MNRSVRFVLFLATFVTANVAWGDGRQISAGFNYTCAVAEGEVVCWGDNEYGQTNVPALTNPTYVSAGGSRSGAHTCAVWVKTGQEWIEAHHHESPLEPK